jgi:homoserine dehydrogenase
VRKPRLELIFVGFGNVARRAVRLLGEMRPRLPFEWTAVAVMTARHGHARADAGLDVAALLERLESGESLAGGNEHSTLELLAKVCSARAEAAAAGRLVCVETTVLDIAAGEPAASHVRQGLRAGAHVVTANKGPVAFAYAELKELAEAKGRRFLFEGAVMDGVPIFNLVRETLPAVSVEGFRGVVNSTTNHILTCLERGQPFDAALAQMQAERIAEADPTLDVDGWDAAAKTAALMNVLFDARVTPHDVDREGIRGVTSADTAAARAEGKRLRLVASADRSTGRGRVRLERVDAADPLAALEGQQNALLLRTDVLGEIGIVQRDGGLTQTAYALVSDLSTIARRA